MRHHQTIAYKLTLPADFAQLLIHGKPGNLSENDQQSCEALLRQLYGQLGRIHDCTMGEEIYLAAWGDGQRLSATFTFTAVAETA